MTAKVLPGENAPASIDREKLLTALGQAFWKIAEQYGFTLNEQAVLLGIKANRQRLVALKKKNEIPDDNDKISRVSHLVAIHKNLRILFPHNREVVYRWMKTKRELLGGKSAMEFIAEDELQSYPRLFSIRRLLDQLRVGS